MPIHRLTAFSVLAAALCVAVPAQATTTSKAHSKSAHAKHAQPQHKQTTSKTAHHKPAHSNKQASAAHHKTAHAHSTSTASSTSVADRDLPTTVATVTTAEVEAAPVSQLLQANTFTTTSATAGNSAVPAWLHQAPVFNPAQMLVQSSAPTYFNAQATVGSSVAAAHVVTGGSATEASEDALATTANERVTDLRKSLITLAMNLRDIRYVRGGNNPSTGFDCSGFVRYVFAHAIGLQLPTNSASQFLAGLKVNRADMKPGDLVFFHTHGKRSISHVGIYISEGRFIHSPTSGKSVEISSLNDAYWSKRFAGAKRPEAIAQVANNG